MMSSQHKKVNCRVFVAVSVGTKSITVAQETTENKLAHFCGL